MIGPLLRYTLLRAVVLAAVLALLALVGLDGLALVAVALLMSGFVSLFVLRGSRDELSRAIVGRQDRSRARQAAADAADDAAHDAAREARGREAEG